MRGAIVVLALVALVALVAAQKDVDLVVANAPTVAYCQNNCTYPTGGECDPNYGCRCFQGYAGPDCSAPIVPLQNRQRVTGNLNAGQWAFYSITVDDNSIQLLVEMVRESSTGDPDLYVRLGAAPDRTHYDYADFSTQQLHTVSILRSAGQLQTGTYYIGVYAYGANPASYSVEPRLYQCPNDCNQRSGHGTCNPVTHTCSCSQGWTLDDCSAAIVALAQPRASYAGTLGAMEWMFFELDISQSQYNADIDYYVEVNKTSSGQVFGYIDLYVAYNRYPTVTDSDYHSNQNTQTNELKICSSSLYAGTWRIGVMNWGFASQNFTLFSSLIVNCPGGCSGHGRCQIEGTCTCNPGWGGADCSFDINAALAGTTSVGTAVGLSFFFLILGAAPFVIYHFFGDRIKAFIASRRGGGSSYSTSDSFPPAGSVQTTATAGSGYQTF